MGNDYIKTAVSLVLPYSTGGREGFVYVKTAKDDKWGLPAGKLNPFENDIIGAMREAREETGLETRVTGFLGLWDFKSVRGSSVCNRVYLGRVCGGEMSILCPEEISDIDVLSIGDIGRKYQIGELRSGLANLNPVKNYIKGRIYPLSVVESF